MRPLVVKAGTITCPKPRSRYDLEAHLFLLGGVVLVIHGFTMDSYRL
jgi:hypothetical protein